MKPVTTFFLECLIISGERPREHRLVRVRAPAPISHSFTTSKWLGETGNSV